MAGRDAGGAQPRAEVGGHHLQTLLAALRRLVAAAVPAEPGAREAAHEAASGCGSRGGSRRARRGAAADVAAQSHVQPLHGAAAAALPQLGEAAADDFPAAMGLRPQQRAACRNCKRQQPKVPARPCALDHSRL